MFNSKIDLFSNEWLEVVFDNKNRNYGAYALRTESSSITTKALLSAGMLFILLFLSPKIIDLVKGDPSIETVKDRKVEIIIQSPPPVNPETPPPASIVPPPAKQSQIAFRPPVVLEDNLVSDIDPVQINDLIDATPGQKDVVGDPDGAIVIEGPTGKGPQGAIASEDRTVYDVFESLEVQPTYPGGMDKFYKYLAKSIRYPALAQENNIQGKVFLSFIIEKNGSLTDIKVERNLGYGTDEEAIRVLMSSPRWLPGIQNGKAVRVKYNIPISFAMAN